MVSTSYVLDNFLGKAFKLELEVLGSLEESFQAISSPIIYFLQPHRLFGFNKCVLISIF